MPKRLILVAVLTVVIGCGIAMVLISKSEKRIEPEAANDSKISTTSPPVISASAESSAQQTDSPSAAVVPATTISEAKPADIAPAELPVMINGYEVQDPMARIALNFVGSDPDAEAYWIGAINDSAVPAEERKDLIEDLNEDGLSDSRHPTAQDMPLILRRIQLIEQLGPNAIDDINRNAFAEAHKDLVDLLNGREPQ